MQPFQQHQRLLGPPTNPNPYTQQPTFFQPPPRQLSFNAFAIPTKDDALSSSFPYSPLLTPLSISPPLWAEFTYSLDNAAKLTFNDDMKAWGAGLASGTAGTFTLLFLGPIAGYYTGKAVHKRTVLEKVKERLRQDGSIYNVLREWNDVTNGEFGRRGVMVELEFPVPEGEGRSDPKRFRLVVRPGLRKMIAMPLVRSQGQVVARPELSGVEVGYRQIASGGNYGEQVGQQPSIRYDPQVVRQQQQNMQNQSADQVLMSGGLGSGAKFATHAQQPDARESVAWQDQEEEAPPLPARPPQIPSKIPLLDSNPIHEAPNTQLHSHAVESEGFRNKEGKLVYELDGHDDIWDMEHGPQTNGRR